MPAYICVTCGVQHADTPTPPRQCAICEDERQYVAASGQQWTTLEALQGTHTNRLRPLEPGLTAITTEPRFAIGQRALLVETPQGNILWDCISLVDEASTTAVQQRGGVSAIAVCHPHFYDSMVEWSQRLGNVPIYLHADDRAWIMRPDSAIVLWEGETLPLCEGVTLIRCGGHFPGSAVLHWQAGAEGRGVLLTGDTITVVADRRYVTFMFSYPNQIPLHPKAVRGIRQAVDPFAFDRIYGGWEGSVVQNDAKGAVARSVQRYLRALAGEYPG